MVSIVISLAIVLALLFRTVNFLHVELSSLWSGTWRPRQLQFDLVSLFIGSPSSRRSDGRGDPARARGGDVPVRVRAPARPPRPEARARDAGRDPQRRDRVLRPDRHQPLHRAGPVRCHEHVHDDGRRYRRGDPHRPTDRVRRGGRDVRGARPSARLYGIGARRRTVSTRVVFPAATGSSPR